MLLQNRTCLICINSRFKPQTLMTSSSSIRRSAAKIKEKFDGSSIISRQFSSLMLIHLQQLTNSSSLPLWSIRRRPLSGGNNRNLYTTEDVELTMSGRNNRRRRTMMPDGLVQQQKIHDPQQTAKHIGPQRSLRGRLNYLNKNLKKEEGQQLKSYNQLPPSSYQNLHRSVDEIKDLLNQLRHRPVDDFYGACQVLRICTFEFEHMQLFVDQCLLNWFASLEPFMDKKEASSSVLAAVVYSLARLNKATSGEIHEKLGWANMEKIASYVFDNPESMKAINYTRMIYGLTQYFRTWKFGKLAGGKMSADFQQKLSRSVPWYCDAVAEWSKTDDTIKFDFLNTIFKITCLDGQRIPDESRDKIARFVCDEFKTRGGDSDKDYGLTIVLNYLYKIDTVFHRLGVKIEDYYEDDDDSPSDFNFWQRWVQRLVRNMTSHPEPMLINRFCGMLMKRMLIVCYEQDLEKLFSRHKNFWLEHMEQSMKLLVPSVAEFQDKKLGPISTNVDHVTEMIRAVRRKKYGPEQKEEAQLKRELLMVLEKRVTSLVG